MKNIRKKEFVIYALALMLVAAGYFNYLNFDFKSIKTSSNVEEKDSDKIIDSKNVTNECDESQVETVSKQTEEKDEENKTNIGDAILVNSNEATENLTEMQGSQDIKDYYVATKLERNKMYAEMIKKYEDLINNNNLSEVQKSIATEEISKINNNKNAIMICENLIISKDFEECVILINDESVNVVVHIKDGLNTEKVSQIQNIIFRELSTEIENIHISEK